MTNGYFCYVSRSKVDQLFNSYQSGEGYEYTETRTSEESFDANASGGLSLAKIMKLFEGGLTYGRKGIVQRERKVKAHYLDKLRQVLTAIASSAVIPEFDGHGDAESLAGLFHYYRGSFRIAEPLPHAIAPISAASVVSVRSERSGSTLVLDCSLRFFSEGNEPDERFALNSTNARFFMGDIALQLETVFLLQGAKRKTIYGTPLYLMMPEYEGGIAATSL